MLIEDRDGVHHSLILVLENMAMEHGGLAPLKRRTRTKRMSMIPMLHSLPTRRTARGLAVDIDCAEKSREASIRDALELAIASP